MEKKISSISFLDSNFNIRVKLIDIGSERELFDVVRRKGNNLGTVENRKEFLLEFGDLLSTVNEIKKNEKITDEELKEIRRINLEKKGGFDKRIFLYSATDDDNPSKKERINIRTLITDKFFERLKNKGVELSFEKLNDVGFENELLKKVKKNGSSLMLIKARKEFLLEFGDLLFLVDEIKKFKNITDEEIKEVETVKNKQK